MFLNFPTRIGWSHCYLEGCNKTRVSRRVGEWARFPLKGRNNLTLFCHKTRHSPRKLIFLPNMLAKNKNPAKMGWSASADRSVDDSAMSRMATQ